MRGLPGLPCPLLPFQHTVGSPLRQGGHRGAAGGGPGVPAVTGSGLGPIVLLRRWGGQALEGLLRPTASSPDSKGALDPNYRKWPGQPSPCMIGAPQTAAD